MVAIADHTSAGRAPWAGLIATATCTLPSSGRRTWARTLGAANRERVKARGVDQFVQCEDVYGLPQELLRCQGANYQSFGGPGLFSARVWTGQASPTS